MRNGTVAPPTRCHSVLERYRPAFLANAATVAAFAKNAGASCRGLSAFLVNVRARLAVAQQGVGEEVPQPLLEVRLVVREAVPHGPSARGLYGPVSPGRGGKARTDIVEGARVRRRAFEPTGAGI